jgi:hypothetical protein
MFKKIALIFINYAQSIAIKNHKSDFYFTLMAMYCLIAHGKKIHEEVSAQTQIGKEMAQKHAALVVNTFYASSDSKMQKKAYEISKYSFRGHFLPKEGVSKLYLKDS